jgi:glutaconate CoA-transferase subunit B
VIDPPTVDDVLALDAEELGPLTHPILLVGLTGWFDVAGVATTALEQLVPDGGAVTVAEIDPDAFYDFTQERPLVEITDGDIRQIQWPSNAFRVVRTGGPHDLVVLSGVEPHLAWTTYIGCVRRVIAALGCEAVVTVGASADTVPHSRMPLVVGSTTDPELARGSAAVLSNEDFYDLCMRGGVDTIFLGAAQIDGLGRTNVSTIGPRDRPKVRLPGGGGAAVIMPTAGRTILFRSEHSRRSFVERLDFVTAAGNVDRVVGPLCVFRREGGELMVESVHPSATVAEVVERTGFPLRLAADPPITPSPTVEELSALAAVDPEDVRRLEFR